MKTNEILLSIFVLFIVYKMPAQNTDTYSTSVYIGLEPLMWVIGEKGGYIDYSVSEKLTFHQGGYFKTFCVILLWEFVRRGFFHVELLILGTCLVFVICGDFFSGTSTDGVNTIKD